METAEAARPTWIAILWQEAKRKFGAAQAPSESLNYETWRQRFLRGRLWLANWIGLACFVTSSALAMLLPSPTDGQSHGWAMHWLIILVCLSACLGWQKSSWGRNHSQWVFLAFCWSMTFVTQVALSLKGEGLPNIGLWTLVFLMLAAVVPVCWRLHLVAQAGVLIWYVLVNGVLGVTQTSSSPDATPVVLAIFIFWICFVCDLAIYLCERLQRSDFNARRELQAFIYAVSQDLRRPVLANLSTLRSVQQQDGASLAITHSTLQMLLQNSDRQLTLISTLLQMADASASARPQPGRATWSLDVTPVGKQLVRVWRQIECTVWQVIQPLWGMGPGIDQIIPAITPAVTPADIDYAVWRHKFILRRLRLVWWIALGCTVTLFIPDLNEAIALPRERPEMWVYVGLAVWFGVWFLLFRTRLHRVHAGWLLLSFAGSLALVYDGIMALAGLAEPSILIWTLLFLILATLIPAYWQFHMALQVGILLFYVGIRAMLNLSPAMEVTEQVGAIWYVFWICLICDLSVYLYERLKRAEFDSRQRLRLFLHAVSHDLKPSIIGSSMVLQNLLLPQTNVTVDRTIPERMEQSCDRQLKLIDSLLESHANHLQGLQVSPQPTDLSSLVADILADLSPLTTHYQATMMVSMADQLPLVNADPNQIWRVFENLITNALKYNPMGIKLSLSAQLDRGWVKCTVQDDGGGIAPEQCDRLFNLYTRGQHNRRSPGLGLGLYLCRQIITAHGGKIGVASQPGLGSCFWFTLPPSE